MPRLGFFVLSQNVEERHNGIERNDRTQNEVVGLESLHLTTGRGVCVYVCVGVSVHVCAFLRVRVRVRIRTRACVRE